MPLALKILPAVYGKWGSLWPNRYMLFWNKLMNIMHVICVICLRYIYVYVVLFNVH